MLGLDEEESADDEPLNRMSSVLGNDGPNGLIPELGGADSWADHTEQERPSWEEVNIMDLHRVDKLRDFNNTVTSFPAFHKQLDMYDFPSFHISSGLLCTLEQSLASCALAWSYAS